MLQPHIQLDGMGIRYAVLPGDPARVERIAAQMEDVKALAFNREYRSVRGSYLGVPVLVMSTGMGGPSAAIAVEELKNIGVTHVIRTGSCGALSTGIALGDLVLASAAVREDGTSRTYLPEGYPAAADTGLLLACHEAARALEVPFHTGLVRSHDSFYIDDDGERSRFWAERGVIASDMETSALFTVARLRGVKAASILNNVVLWGNDTLEGVGGYAGGLDPTRRGERAEAAVALEALARVEKGGLPL